MRVKDRFNLEILKKKKRKKGELSKLEKVCLHRWDCVRLKIRVFTINKKKKNDTN